MIRRPPRSTLFPHPRLFRSASPGRMQDLFKNNRRVFDALGRKVTPYEWNKEVAPGITAVGTPGHTPGHTSYIIASGSSRVYVQDRKSTRLNSSHANISYAVF